MKRNEDKMQNPHRKENQVKNTIASKNKS